MCVIAKTDEWLVCVKFLSHKWRPHTFQALKAAVEGRERWSTREGLFAHAHERGWLRVSKQRVLRCRGDEFFTANCDDGEVSWHAT